MTLPFGISKGHLEESGSWSFVGVCVVSSLEVFIVVGGTVDH